MLIRWLSVSAIFNLCLKFYSSSPSSVLFIVILVIIVTTAMKIDNEQVIKLANLKVYNFLGNEISIKINMNKDSQVILPWKLFPILLGTFSTPKISINKTGKVSLNKHK